MTGAVELKQSFDDITEWLDLKLISGRYSFGLALELARHAIARSINTFNVFDEIGRLEGSDTRPSMTKPAAPFTGKVLQGLWHKHYHQARFIPQNLLLEMSRPGAMRAVLSPHFGKLFHEVSDEITHALTIEAYERRSRERRMTGEWLIFEPEPTGNYYLTLSSHKGETDDDRRDRIRVYKEVDRLLKERTS